MKLMKCSLKYEDIGQQLLAWCNICQYFFGYTTGPTAPYTVEHWDVNIVVIYSLVSLWR